MAIDSVIKIGDLKGESLRKGKKDYMDVLSWSWGASQSGNFHVGGGGGAGKANVQDLSFVKWADGCSNDLLLKCLKGKHYPEAELVCTKADGGDGMDYIKITMKQVLVSSISMGGSGGEDRLTENVSLHFAQVKFEYNPQDETGKALGWRTTAFDIAQNT